MSDFQHELVKRTAQDIVELIQIVHPEATVQHSGGASRIMAWRRAWEVSPANLSGEGIAVHMVVDEGLFSSFNDEFWDGFVIGLAMVVGRRLKAERDALANKPKEAP